jgi:hypothetical protein
VGEINKSIDGDHQAIVVTCKPTAKRHFDSTVRDTKGAPRRFDPAKMVYPQANGQTSDDSNLFAFHV